MIMCVLVSKALNAGVLCCSLTPGTVAVLCDQSFDPLFCAQGPAFNSEQVNCNQYHSVTLQTTVVIMYLSFYVVAQLFEHET